MAADRREIVTVLTGRETISKAAERAERAVDDLGDELRATAEDAKLLDRRIDEVNRSLESLAVQYARTGDDTLIRNIREQERELRRLTKARKLLDAADGAKSGIKIGARIAEGIARGLSRAGGPILSTAEGIFGALPPKVQVAVGAAVVAGVASAAPIVGGSLAAAVVGGAGVGGVIGGLAVAARHAAVQEAASHMGQTFMGVLERYVGAAFVQPAIGALGQLHSMVIDIKDDLGRIAQSASRFVQPLTAGVTGFVREILPGLERAVDRAGPIIDEIADWGPRLGRLLSDVLSDFADDAAEAAQALRMLWTIFEIGVEFVAGTINFLTEAFKWADLLSSALYGRLPQALVRYEAAELRAAQGGGTLTAAMDEVMAGFEGVGGKADDAAVEISNFGRAIHELNNMQLELNDAERAFQQAIDDAAAAFDKKVDKIDLSTERGRRYSQHLDQIASTAQRAAQEVYDITGSVELANAKFEEGRQALYKQARQYGLTEQAAWDYVNAVMRIPPEWETKVTADTRQAEAQLRVIQSKIDKLKKTHILVRGTVQWTSRGLHVPGGTILERSLGGPVEGPGPRGVDSIPAMLAPGEHVWTAREVQAAGGHAAVEALRRMVLGRGRVPAQPPSVAPAAPARAVSPARMVLELRSSGSRVDDLLIELLRRAVRVRGGNVQVVLGGRP